MYKEVFNFTSRPFTSAPYVKHYFASESMHQTLTKAQDCIDRSAGPVIAVGGPGTGKSLLLGMLEEKYQSQFSVANLTCIRLQERADLLKSILFTLDQPHQGMSEGDLRFALINYLKPSANCPNGVLLLVDDAQTLGPGLLDEIRLITNFVRDGQARVRLVLAGTQTLEDNLASPKLQSLNQRIAARCYLTSMRRDETAKYITEHIDRAGGNGGQLFDPQSLKTVHEVSDGCPRLVNQVCEHALIVASTRGATEITENHVREAWDNVQGIPGDWSAPEDSQQDTTTLQNDDGWTVIEFGQLDEDEQSEPAGTVYDFENSEGEASDANDANDASAEEAEKMEETINPAVTSDQPEETSAEFESPAVAEFQTHPTPQVDADPQAQLEPVTQFTPQLPSPAEPVLSETPEPESAPETDDEPTVEQIAAANGVTLRQPVETVDPFEESFAEEEHLQDRFAPVVARQNHASLNVTSADLEAIKPDEDPSSQDTPQLQVRTEPTQVEQVSEPEQTRTPVALTPAVQVIGLTPTEADSFEATQPATEPAAETDGQFPTPTNTPSGVSEPVATSVENETPTISEPQPDRDVVTEDTQEIERQAEEILERLRLSTVSHETDEATATNVQDTPRATQEDQTRELDESQKVLEEILSQKSILTTARNQTTQPAEDELAAEPNQAPPNSINLEYPVAEPSSTEEPRRDDSEMLIVSRMEQKMESPKSSKPDPIPFPETPVSKGKAQRMDYQKLFDQLRDISRDQV